jgi:hypothetical protein
VSSVQTKAAGLAEVVPIGARRGASPRLVAERALSARDDFLREVASAQDELLHRGSAVDGVKVRLRRTVAERAHRRVTGPFLFASLASAALVFVMVVMSRAGRRP